MPCWPRPIKGSPRMLVLVLCCAHYAFRAVPTRARAHAHSCRAYTCRVVPRKNSPLSFFSFFVCLRAHVKLLSYFFSILCTFFWIHVPLFKFNRIKNSKLKSIFNNNKLIIIRECNISC